MFANILEMFTNLSTTYKAALGVGILVVLYFAYTMYMKRQAPVAASQQMHSAPSHSSGSGGEHSAGNLTCTMYFTEWCKFCKKAKPEWAKLAEKYNGQTINGKTIAIVAIDCDKNEEVAERENIKGYPTFKFNLNGKYVDYPDEPEYEKFETFINYLCGQ